MAGYPSDAVSSPDSTRPLRGAVLGLGMIGRHHARLLQASPRVAFAGAVDPGGDRFASVPHQALPLPDRVRDVGVIMDLATHDLDLVRWLGGAPVERLSAETQHRMGRAHEDLLLATGRLDNAISFNCVVDWLSPAKVRQTRVLGERGMLVADTLTADLTFYENGDVASAWENTQSLRGVSEGN